VLRAGLEHARPARFVGPVEVLLRRGALEADDLDARRLLALGLVEG
jgi:hypothetical protein